MSCAWFQKSTPGDALLTSSGLSTPEVELTFLRLVLCRKGVVSRRKFARVVRQAAVRGLNVNQHIKEKYAHQLRSLRVLVLSDPAYFFEKDQLETLGWEAKQEPTVFFHRSFMFPTHVCGGFALPEENITHVTLWDKPWILNGGTCLFSEDGLFQSGPECDEDEVNKYVRLLTKVRDRVKQLQDMGPMLAMFGGGDAGMGGMPGGMGGMPMGGGGRGRGRGR